MAVVGLALVLFSRGGSRSFYAQEGFAATGISWIVLSLFGALPFCLSGETPNYVDALFEIVSGFTTTGASILSDVEALSRCNLYWRSFSHWLGGMGILVFLLAVVPEARKSAGSGMYLMRAESPRPSVGKPDAAPAPDGADPVRPVHAADRAVHRLSAARRHAAVRQPLHRVRHRRHRRLCHPQQRHGRLQRVPAERRDGIQCSCSA